MYMHCDIPLKTYDNKQLLDEVEHDIVNYQNRGLCYLPKPTKPKNFDYKVICLVSVGDPIFSLF